MKNFWKSLLKFLFGKSQLDEKVAETLETVKDETAKLDEKFDKFKEKIEKEGDVIPPVLKTKKKK